MPDARCRMQDARRKDVPPSAAVVQYHEIHSEPVCHRANQYYESVEDITHDMIAITLVLTLSL